MMIQRSTTDIVVIILTTMVSILMITLLLGAIFVKIKRPETDLKAAGALFANVTTTIVGALVGFIGGRAAGRAEGLNGENK